MKGILLKDVPDRCPRCEVRLFGSAPRPRVSNRAWLVVVLGVLVNLAWAVYWFLYGEYQVMPGRGLQWLVFVGTYGWPFMVTALFVSRMPMAVKTRCFKCGEVRRYLILIP